MLKLDTVAGTLLESDALYFELAAEQIPLNGAVLAWMPGFESLAAGCVVQRVRPEVVRENPEGWLLTVEAAVRMTGAALARMYLPPDIPGIENSLRRAGYQSRVEVVLASNGAPPEVDSAYRLRPVQSEEDWRLKEWVHHRCEAPDGYENPAREWTRFIRAKCATGGKESFLIERDGEVVGCVGAMCFPGVVRLKNLCVMPEFRRQGAGSQAVGLMWQRAADRDSVLGAFAVEGRGGEKLYRRRKLEAVASLVEWRKSL